MFGRFVLFNFVNLICMSLVWRIKELINILKKKNIHQLLEPSVMFSHATQFFFIVYIFFPMVCYDHAHACYL